MVIDDDDDDGDGDYNHDNDMVITVWEYHDQKYMVRIWGIATMIKWEYHGNNQQYYEVQGWG
jgi:hypothetical protein